MTIKAGFLPGSLARSYERLLSLVVDRPAWVAFSGGVDSTLTLKAISEVNSTPIKALFADSPLQSEFDLDNAKKLADQLSIQLQVVPFNPLAQLDFIANPSNRCYLCKKFIFEQFIKLLPVGFILMDGTNHDDLGADRPGHRALVELGVLSPLALAGINKTDVRELARWLGLSNWNRPSSSCLATRIPSGVAITRELLRLIEECESRLRHYGFGHIRVRFIGGRQGDLCVELAREEMDRADFSQIQEFIRNDFVGLVEGKVVFIGRNGVFCRQII